MDRRGLLNDPVETQMLILDGRQSLIWTAIPGIIQSVNLTQMTCVVQPAIQAVVYDQNNNASNVNLPLLLDVPIVFPGNNKFTITFPLVIGDEVLVVFSSRCIDNWWQSGAYNTTTGINPVPQAEMRMHDLSDGFAIPGPKSLQNVVPSISSTDLQIRNAAGSSYISITSEGNVKITAPTITFTGNLNVTGAIVATGEVTGNSIPLSTHVHPVTTAPGTTGAPT